MATLDPHLEQLILKNAGGVSSYSCAMRKLLEFVGDDEPLRFKERAFWLKLRDRAIEAGNHPSTMNQYVTRACTAVRLTQRIISRTLGRT